ncbi:hypothetical protein J4H86_02420 [Spiractinospora alimapuensis]|uniref:styrene monooxygenase/indole monooxygenase family protein n=1 Tax=Spiractinospora alimapuensis TaxID=2820884 RepID=UPI001F3714F7|nr:styrene monooxygenase/indole monooxygenase family protein [Spiractinospora alimapuensis]QVQ52703.1 hypothetical protein J4H86_02420 [Spiractinospora alimapuensis]
MTARDPDELYDGGAVSAQILFDQRRHAEGEYGLNLWDDEAKPIVDYRFTSSGEMPHFDWTGKLTRPAQSIDERVKMSAWLDLLEHKGGKVLIHGVTGSDLDSLSQMFDLTIIASGHSGLADIFSIDTGRGLARMPPVATAIAYVEEIDGHPDSDGVGIDLVPGLGHLISWPALSVNGPCRLVHITGPADGPLARWPRRTTPDQHYALMLEVMREFIPHQYTAFSKTTLADDGAVAMDRANPLVREPIAHMPSGGLVMGMGDTVAVTSPALQQDANNASMAAEIYLRAILDHEDAPFDAEFMTRTFERFMDYAQHFTGLVAQRMHYPPPYVIELFVAATHSQELADYLVNGMGDPPALAPWFTEETRTRSLIERHQR